MEPVNEIKELVLFRVAEILCGVNIDHVQEINKNLDFTTVYRAPKFVKGVLNLRRQIVSIIDLRVKFEREPIELKNTMRVIIVHHNDENVGLLVDEINDVIEVDQTRLEHSTSNLNGVEAIFFAGMYKMEEELAVILDINEILKSHERSSAIN